MTKRMMLATLFLLTLTVSASQSPRPQPECRFMTMVRLVADPERYEGQLLCVIGVAHFEAEESALYLSREHSELVSGVDAIWLDAKVDQALSGQFVSAQGRFTAKKHGHLGIFSGELEGVSELRKVWTRQDRRGRAGVSE